jgi:hypothetical protein
MTNELDGLYEKLGDEESPSSFDSWAPTEESYAFNVKPINDRITVVEKEIAMCRACGPTMDAFAVAVPLRSEKTRDLGLFKNLHKTLLRENIMKYLVPRDLKNIFLPLFDTLKSIEDQPQCDASVQEQDLFEDAQKIDEVQDSDDQSEGSSSVPTKYLVS